MAEGTEPSNCDKSSIDLSLSCSFTDTEYSASDDDLQGSDGGIKPYMYEPIVGDSGGGGSEEPDSLGKENLTNTNWY